MSQRENSDNDPKMKELLRQISSIELPDYPNYRRGRIWGSIAGGGSAAILLVFIAICGQANDLAGRLWRNGWTAFAVGAALFLIAGAIGAFRPPRD